MMLFLKSMNTILFHLLILMTIQSIAIVLSSCPTGWVKWRQSCYILLPEKMNWMQAEAACKRPGSNLIVPDSEEENHFIFEWAVKRKGGVWIGCTDAERMKHTFSTPRNVEHAQKKSRARRVKNFNSVSQRALNVNDVSPTYPKLISAYTNVFSIFRIRWLTFRRYAMVWQGLKICRTPIHNSEWMCVSQ